MQGAYADFITRSTRAERASCHKHYRTCSYCNAWYRREHTVTLGEQQLAAQQHIEDSQDPEYCEVLSTS
jgi:hypothetical protein